MCLPAALLHALGDDALTLGTILPRQLGKLIIEQGFRRLRRCAFINGHCAFNLAGRLGQQCLLLLLVPAVSLSGMADSRMERRLGELGVRRAFGAPKGALIGQVLMENFLYTLLGGLVGLLFSFLLVTFASSWVFKIGNGFSDAAPDGVDVSLSMGMLFNPWVFLIALCVCFLLNLMSALWPAWRASRRPIVDSLNA